MSVRQAFLALLSSEPMHCYQLKVEFEQRTGGTWPLNIGQAYTTLNRLQRDGLIAALPVEADGPERFGLTDAGRQEAAGWWSTPVGRGAPARDELAIKLALAVTVPGVDLAALVQGQRAETMRALRDYTLLRRRDGDPDADTRDTDGAHRSLAWSLVLDGLIFAAEAEMRWLDHVEARVLRERERATARPAASADAAAALDPARRTR